MKGKIQNWNFWNLLFPTISQSQDSQHVRIFCRFSISWQPKHPKKLQDNRILINQKRASELNGQTFYFMFNITTWTSTALHILHCCGLSDMVAADLLYSSSSLWYASMASLALSFQIFLSCSSNSYTKRPKWVNLQIETSRNSQCHTPKEKGEMIIPSISLKSEHWGWNCLFLVALAGNFSLLLCCREQEQFPYWIII